MAAAIECPDRATMLRLCVQGGTNEEVESLTGHLEQCAHCGEQFDELLRKDDVTLGCSAEVTALPESDALKALRERLGRLRPLAPVVKSEETVGLGSNGVSGAAVAKTGVEPALAFLAPPQEPDEIGRLGPYRILKKLGAGGMGMVFLAEDPLLKRKVALKTMLPTIAVNPQARERFLREARAAAAIEHAHIIAIHQVGEDNGVPYLAMPFLKGESLDDRLARDKKLPATEALRITYEMADGLAAAHGQGLIHRDIKPGNVWLEEQPARSRAPGTPAVRGPAKVKVLDFGLARSEVEDTHLTHTGTIIGTPAFMAPEQARGVHVDARADLFSLGCVLYVMLTGQRPFTGATTMALLTALAVDTPKSPREVNPAIPAALSDFTMRLLAKRPEDRPASALDVLDELRNVVKVANEAKKTSQKSSIGSIQIKQVIPAVDPPEKPATEAIVLASPPKKPTTEALVQVPPPTLKPRPERAVVTTPAPRRSRTTIFVALAMLFLIGGGLAAYQLIFKTADGTLIVEVDGDDTDIRFQKGELRVFDSDGTLKYTLKPSERNRALPPGKYLVQVTGADGLTVDTDKFEIKKGGKATVRVTVNAAAVARTDAKGKATERIANADRELFPPQSVWRDETGVVLTVLERTEDTFRAQIEVTGGDIKREVKGIIKNGQFSWLAKDVIAIAGGPGGDNTGTITRDKDGDRIDLVWRLPSTGQTGAKTLRRSEPGADRRAAEWVLSIGGHVKVAAGQKEENIDALANLPAQPFHVVFIGLSEDNIQKGKVTDSALVNLRGLTRLSGLHIRHTGITDAGLEHIQGLASLADLDLYSSPAVTDAGMKHLQGLTNLITLKIGGTKVTDAGLQRLQSLKKIRHLNLAHMPVTSAGLENLKVLTDLQSLDLWGITMTEAGFRHLQNLPALTQLNLADAHVSDASLAPVGGLLKLESIILDRTEITDAGLAHLQVRPELKSLNLTGTKVTAVGVKKLAGVRPNTTIVSDHGTFGSGISSADPERKAAE